MNLHWDVLRPAKIERTVWEKTVAHPESVASDVEVRELEKLFSRKSAPVSASCRRATQGVENASGRRGAGRGERGEVNSTEGGQRADRNTAGRKGKKVQLLDVSRGNNVAIGLKAFRKIGFLELAGVIGALDPGGENVAYCSIVQDRTVMG